MPQRFIHIADVPENDRGSFSYQRIIGEKDNDYNMLEIAVYGRHPKRRVLQGVRNYYVVSGSGSFTVAGEQQDVEEGATIIIHSGEVYEYSAYTGGMKLLETNVNIDISKGPLHEDLE